MNRKSGKKGMPLDLETAELYDRITKLETKILDKIREVKSTPRLTPCQHLKELPSFQEPYDDNCNYYDKYWRQFIKNELILRQVQIYQEQNNILQKKLKKLDKKFEERQTIIGPYGKKNYKKRDPKWVCKVCTHVYHDEDRFLLHMRLQHPTQITQEEVGRAIEEIFQSEESFERSY